MDLHIVGIDGQSSLLLFGLFLQFYHSNHNQAVKGKHLLLVFPCVRQEKQNNRDDGVFGALIVNKC